MALNNVDKPDNQIVGSWRIAERLHLDVLSGDPGTPEDGDIWRTSAGLRMKIGANTLTLNPDAIDVDFDDPVMNGTATVNGTLITVKDNATSFRLKGPDFNSVDVQSYAGIFYNAGYTTLGTLETRASYGANLEMDLALQSPHALLLLAVDGTQTDGKIVATSQTGMYFHTRADAEVLSPKRIVLDRETQGSTGAANTSNATVETNSGDLVLWPGREGAEADAKVTIKTLVHLTPRGSDPASPIEGDVWYRSDTNKLRLQTNVGAVDLN